jgi:hypothetical protein
VVLNLCSGNFRIQHTQDLQKSGAASVVNGCNLSEGLNQNHQELYGFTLWLFNIAMENGPFIDGLPIKNGDFPWLC